MADYTELKQRAEELIEIERVAPCGSKRVMLIDPVAILALIAESERLSADEQEEADLCDCLSGLLRNTALEVRGPEEPLQRHGFHDLPSRVKTVVAERDQLKAELAGLKTGYEAYEQVSAGWKAEVERITADNTSLRGSCAKLGANHAGLVRAMRRQEKELDALREDAERYRWLRDQCGIVEYQAIAGSIGSGMLPSGENLDAALSDAMGKGEQS